MTLKATQKRARIAAVLARSERLGWNPPTAREIGDICGERNSSDWAHGPLRDMERQGLVERVGAGFDNARTWRLTQAGATWAQEGRA